MDAKVVLSQVRYGLHVVVRPFDGFWDLKHEKKGSLASAFCIVFLLLAARLSQYQFSGFFAVTQQQRDKVGLIIEIAKIVLPYVLWIVSNWSLTTLLDGEGSMKDIAVSTAYCLVPMILFIVPLTVLSNFVTLDENLFLNVFMGISIFWSGLLIFISVIVTHQYTILKAILTILLSVVCMGILLFLSMLVVSLIQQIAAFVMIIFQEASLRWL